MPRVTSILRKGRKAIEDVDLLKLLQSEITHELSFNRFQNDESGSLGDFAVDWDSEKSQDVVLRKKCGSGEEVAVSALLGDEIHGEGRFPRDALMKICIKKPSLRSILQFDCAVSIKGDNSSDFDIRNAHYLESSTCLGSSVYRGPLFSTLDPHLQDELKQYLVAKGIGENLTNFLLLHLHKKEQGQYVNWLHKLASTVSQND